MSIEKIIDEVNECGDPAGNHVPAVKNAQSWQSRLGITPESTAKAIAGRRVRGWVCTAGGTVVGFCTGYSDTGEVMVLAVLPEYEARGIGRRLLMLVVEWLRSCNNHRIWLAASPDPKVRAYGFYRSLGWHTTGERLENGDEILVLVQDA